MRHLTARRRVHQRGVTLMELMVGLAIVAIAALASVPYLTDFVVNSRLREAGHALMFEAMLARSEALKRNARVRVSVEGSSIAVAEVTDSGEPITIRSSVLPGGVSATKVSLLTFGTEGRPTPLGTTASFDLILDRQTCSADIRCPSLRVEAGGAIRLCRDRTQEGC